MSQSIHGVHPATQSIFLPVGAWYAESQLEFPVPLNWQVDVFDHCTLPQLSNQQFADSFRTPHSFPPLADWIGSTERVAIAVDDVARPTMAGPILDALFDVLVAQGISEERVTIVIGVGTHSPPDPPRIRAKLGERAFQNSHIEVHAPHGDLIDTQLPYGDRTLRLNRTFCEAPLKICIGSILPHPFAGFSGGAKMLIPGLSDVPTTDRTHKFVLMGLRGGTDPSENKFRTEIERLIKPLGPILAIQSVPNDKRQTCALFVGDIVAAHRAACQFAETHFAAPVRGEYDCIIMNAYPKDTDLLQSQGALVALKTLSRSPLREGGVGVLVTAASTGVGIHELFGPGGICLRTPRPLKEFAGRELWVLAPSLQEADIRWYFHDSVRFFSNPMALCEALLSRLGPTARCGVARVAPMQRLVESR